MKSIHLALVSVFCLGLSGVAQADTASNLPVKEAVQACEGKTENVSCSYTDTANQATNGTCMKGTTGTKLACVPTAAKGTETTQPQTQTH